MSSMQRCKEKTGKSVSFRFVFQHRLTRADLHHVKMLQITVSGRKMTSVQAIKLRSAILQMINLRRFEVSSGLDVDDLPLISLR